MLEQIYEAIRRKYKIPENATIDISEEIYAGSCCHDYGYNEVFINYEYVPEGKKRKIRRAHVYNGTVWELIQEL